jgi:ribosomal protein S12 methylthiotransferase accessory factor
VASTNGLASGNHRLEAIVHAICEVIERDAHTLWEHMPHHQKHATRVDLSSISDPDCLSLIKALSAADMKVGVWDMTSDVGVATFHCLITDERVEHGHSGGGAGTHPSRNVALLRALTEAVQVRTNYITGARDDLRDDEYETAGIAQKTRYASGLMADENIVPGQYNIVPSQNMDTLEADLEWLITRLTAVGIQEVIDVELTKPDFEIPVHRVIIPGLEGPHDHADYCPGDRARERFSR